MPGGVVRSHPWPQPRRLRRQPHSSTRGTTPGRPRRLRRQPQPHRGTTPAGQSACGVSRTAPPGNHPPTPTLHQQEAPHHVFIHQPHPLQRSGHAPQPHSWFRHRLLPGLQHLPFRGCGHEHCPPERHEACLDLYPPGRSFRYGSRSWARK